MIYTDHDPGIMLTSCMISVELTFGKYVKVKMKMQ